MANIQALIEHEKDKDQEGLEQQLLSALSRVDLTQKEFVFLFGVGRHQWLIAIKRDFDRKVFSLGINTFAELPRNVETALASVLQQINIVSHVSKLTFKRFSSREQFNSADEAVLWLQKNINSQPKPTRLFENNRFSCFGGQSKRATSADKQDDSLFPRGTLH